jgi:hypothetical protein
MAGRPHENGSTHCKVNPKYPGDLPVEAEPAQPAPPIFMQRHEIATTPLLPIHFRRCGRLIAGT